MGYLDDNDWRQPSWREYIPSAQVFLVIVGLLGAALHAFPIKVDANLDQDWPILDVPEIAWLALIPLAALLPGISKLTVSGFSVELKEEVRESQEEFEEALGDYANLAQNWSTSAVLYIKMLSEATNDQQRADLLVDYLQDRMGEAKEFLSAEPSDDVRIMLWIEDLSGGLDFYFSNERPPKKEHYESGEGMLGRAFRERRRYNVSDVRSVPSYEDTRDGEPPPYRAVLCMPVFIGDEPIGMLTADKKSATLFSAASEDVAKGLASQCALAIDQFRKYG
ncbi:MAG TPA: GAF domain-containing protein [Candidatus Cybelea sp.]|jgi:GAF domain-containing protein